VTQHSLGQSVARLEDPRLLTGRGTYTADIDADGQLHMAVVRSPHAHAEILRLDVETARAAEGVVGAHAEADLTADGLGPLPCPVVFNVPTELTVPPRLALARGRVRHVGDAVAFVVAESAGAAVAAAELVEVDYAALPAVTDSEAALAGGAPEIWAEAPGNLAFHYRNGDAEAAEAAMAGAAHVVELSLVNNRVSAAPVEPRAALARYDAAGDAFDLTLTGQGLHGIRNQMAGPVFGLPPARLRLSAPDVGGGFGMKNFAYPEWVMLLWAARRHRRPVKWVAERVEDFLAAAHGRDLRARVRLALDAEGRFLALSSHATANMGAYLSANGPGCPTRSFSTALSGVYAIPAVYMEVRGVFTNTVPVDAYRGAGKPEANYIVERLIDRAARVTGIDPVSLRRRNIIGTFPHRSALGMSIDGGSFGANIDAAVRLADRDGFEARREASLHAGRYRGLGLACFLETSRGAPGESAEVRFAEDGKVELLVGTESNGQGHETTYTQIAAERLGLPFECFRYVQADTARVRSGHGHGGARSMHQGGGAMAKALDAVLAKARPVAAKLLQAEADSITFADSRFTVRGTERFVPLAEVAAAARDPGVAGDGAADGLDSFVQDDNDLFTFPNGCHVAEVEIDPDTGSVRIERYLIVDDYGRLLNPALTSGQVQGGVAQGIGQALSEGIVYDPDSGQLLSASLMDYALPRAADLPAFEVHFQEVPTASNPLGVKGSGQAGCMAAPQTVMNAILDALAPLGVEQLDMPATPERVWRAIRSAGR